MEFAHRSMIKFVDDIVYQIVQILHTTILKSFSMVMQIYQFQIREFTICYLFVAFLYCFSIIIFQFHQSVNRSLNHYVYSINV